MKFVFISAAKLGEGGISDEGHKHGGREDLQAVKSDRAVSTSDLTGGLINHPHQASSAIALLARRVNWNTAPRGLFGATVNRPA